MEVKVACNNKQQTFCEEAVHYARKINSIYKTNI